jgi:Putative zinc-finger
VNEHLGDDAELYPLGILDSAAARAVEEHIETCPSCARRVADARAAAGSLATALPGREPPDRLEKRLRESATTQSRERTRNRFDFGWAFAAALVLALFALGWQTLVLRDHLVRQNRALAMLVHSHFNHASMVPEPGVTVDAKVLYARDGSWIYIIVDKPNATFRAVAQTPVGTKELGTLRGWGETATLLSRPRVRVNSIALKRGSATVASLVLVYSH